MAVISIDGMGGDTAPNSVIVGLAQAAVRLPKFDFLLHGNESKMRGLLPERLEKRVKIIDAPEVINADDKPSKILRNAAKSSMGMAINAVKSGAAAAVISAGNTGAFMALAKLTLRTVDGVERPAFATFMPHLHGEFVALDLGANVDCSSEQLVQFAKMGSVFSKVITGLDTPRVALLNVGSEETKGPKVVREAAEVLRAAEEINFVGFVEGDGVTHGVADVVVSDGFAGNLMLKTAEGYAKLTSSYLKQVLRSSILNRFAALLLSPSLRRLKVRVDPRRYNGAVLLGVKGVVVKSHGGSDGLAFASAVELAANMVEHGFSSRILAAFGAGDKGDEGDK